MCERHFRLLGSFLFLQLRRFQRSQRENVNLWRLYQGNPVRLVKRDESMGTKLNFYFRAVIAQCESFPPGKIDD